MPVWQTEGMQSLWHSRRGLVDIEGKEIAAKHCMCVRVHVCVCVYTCGREGGREGGREEVGKMRKW